MFAADAHDGIKLKTESGFRSMNYQTGCAIELTTPGVPAADGSFAMSKAFGWLERNAGGFGFHLPFPRGNKYSYEYEPWHWRYIAGSATGR